jgi:hypothetical protein
MSAITIDWVRVVKANTTEVLERRITDAIEGQDDYETVTMTLAQSEDDDELHYTALLHFTLIEVISDDAPEE